jgi:ATP-dependent Clp endopeptidase proteolytic subunit ClpP
MTTPAREQVYVSVLGTGVDLDRRTIYIMGEINSDAAYRFIPAIKILDETEGDIKIMMNSPGGEESSGYAIFDAIMLTKNQVIIEGYGQISSIASIIIQAGDKRYLSPGCELLIHNGSVGMDDEIKQDHIMDLADSIRRGNKRYHTILVDNSYLSLDEVQQLCKEEKYFSSKEAVEAGLVDGILAHVKKKVRFIKKRKKK